MKCIFFKYAPINANTLSCLTNNSVWFSNYELLNDPEDCNPRIVNDINENQLDEILKFQEIKNYQKINKTDKYQIIKKSLIDLIHKSGVFCVNTNPLDPLMWSHYADKHKGILIGYGVAEKNIGNKQYPDRNPNIVEYSGRGIIKLSDYWNWVKKRHSKSGGLSFSEIIMNSYFKKTNAWSYESEYRFLSINEFGLRNIELSIELIIFGLKTNQENKELVKKIIPERVKKFDLKLISNGFSLKKA